MQLCALALMLCGMHAAGGVDAGAFMSSHDRSSTVMVASDGPHFLKAFRQKGRERRLKLLDALALAHAPGPKTPFPRAQPIREAPALAASPSSTTTAPAPRPDGFGRVQAPSLAAASGGAGWRAPGLKGFENGGNTCYIASAFQLLLNTPALLSFVTVGGNAKDLGNPRHAQLVTLLQDMADAYRSQPGTPITKSQVNKVRELLERSGLSLSREQQDAADVFMKFLEPFDASQVPGIGLLSRHVSTASCDPASTWTVRHAEPWVYEDAASWMAPEWRDLAGGSCGSKSPPIADLATVYVRDGSATLWDLLEGQATPHGMSRADFDKLYDGLGPWAPCSGTGESFAARPRAGQFCRGDVQLPVDLLRVIYGQGLLDVYHWLWTDSWAFPDAGIAIVRVQRQRAGSLAHLSIGEHGEAFLRVRGQWDQIAPFALSACTCYSPTGADAQSGHWTAFVREPGGSRRWFKLDDSVVAQVEPSEAWRQCGRCSTLLVLERQAM